MNVIQKAIDAFRHPGETPDQTAHRRGIQELAGREPAYRSSVYPTQSSTQLADLERDRRQAQIDRGVTLGTTLRELGWREPAKVVIDPEGVVVERVGLGVEIGRPGDPLERCNHYPTHVIGEAWECSAYVTPIPGREIVDWREI